MVYHIKLTSKRKTLCLCKSTGTTKIWFEFKPHAWTFPSIVHPKKQPAFQNWFQNPPGKAVWQMTRDGEFVVFTLIWSSFTLELNLPATSQFQLLAINFPVETGRQNSFFFFEFWISLWHRMFYIYGLFVFQTQMKLGKMIPKLQQDEINAIIVKFNNQVLEN